MSSYLPSGSEELQGQRCELKADNEVRVVTATVAKQRWEWVTRCYSKGRAASHLSTHLLMDRESEKLQDHDRGRMLGFRHWLPAAPTLLELLPRAIGLSG